MRIATWNINGVKARQPELEKWLRQENPDVVCLQELKSVDEGFPRAEIEALGYNVETHGQKSWNGVAILSKHRFDEVHRGLPGDDSDEQARLIEGVFSVEGGAIRVCGIYLPNGNPIGTDKFDYKLKWLERLRVHAADLLAAERPTVLAGDYNVIPEDRDTFSRRAMADDALFQPESQAAFRTIVNQGWTDALRALRPAEPKLFTFWDYQAGAWQRDAGFRIDHLLCSPQAADRLRGAEVHKWARAEEKASDHAPVCIDLA